MELASDDPEYHNSREDMWQQFIRNDGSDIFGSDYQKRGQAGLDAGQAIGRGGGILPIGDGWLREMTDDEFAKADEFTIELSDFYSLFSP